MTDRDKKMVKVLSVLVPVLLLALWYGYSQIQSTKARAAERRRRAEERNQQRAENTQENQESNNTASRGTGASGAAPAAAHANASPAPPSSGVHVGVDEEAQGERSRLAWVRDPFVPPDTQGPAIKSPGDFESPRNTKTIELKINISDRDTGNSGVESAVLLYGTDQRVDVHQAEGSPPAAESRDGEWTFVVPAPGDDPVSCYVVATDRGKLQSETRSPMFRITPPPRETVQTQVGGTEVKLTLRGISWAGDTGVALINDDVVAAGEYIHGYEVTKIVKNGVVLKRNDQEIFLQLKE